MCTRRQYIRQGKPGVQDTQLSTISNFIWGVAGDFLPDLYVRGKYRDMILPMTALRQGYCPHSFRRP